MMRVALTPRKSVLLLLGLFLILISAPHPVAAFPDYGTVVTGVTLATVGSQTAATNLGNVVLGPYGLNIPGVSGVEYMMCFDAFAHVYWGQPWTAEVTDTAGAIALFSPLGDQKIAEKINMIAWLSTQWNAANPPTTAYNGNINLLVWEIMKDYGTNDGLNFTNGGFQLNGRALVAAQANPDLPGLLAGALAHASITTPANFLIPLKGNAVDTSIQPFVSQPVPEPATLLLLGSGLIGLGLHGWRKRNRSQH